MGSIPRGRFGIGTIFTRQTTEMDTRAEAQRIIDTHARTSFSFAARFLPRPQRDDAIDLYAFFRTLDDLVDTCPASGNTPAVVAELDAWDAWLDGRMTGPAPREPLGRHTVRVIERYGIPVTIFHQMLAGLRADLGARAFTSDADLQTYCYQVASTVGCAMAHVLGATSPQALMAAEKLGAAMQLTNILRDVGEDLELGRVYLPVSTLSRYDLCSNDLLAMHANGGPDERFRVMMRDQVEHARALYEQAMPGIWLLPPDCRLPILVAARLYRHLLTLIERHEYDTLHRRVATSRFDKAQEALICWATLTLRRPAPSAATSCPLPHGSTIEARGD
jgi:phytoene synthase